jgi:Fe-S-cluster containining protein
VTGFEARALWDRIERRWSEEEVVALKAVVREKVRRIQEMFGATNLKDTRGVRDYHEAMAGISRLRRPCPLLDQSTGLCRVYEVRPLACRQENSVDVDACKRFKDDPDEPVSSLQLAFHRGRGGRVGL